jgi:E3 ubiquitin-protein ligase HUWE1
MSTRSQPHPDTAVRNAQPSWLNISLDAALGCRASVFTIVKQPGKRGKTQDAANVTIHPQAAPIVFRYAICLPPFPNVVIDNFPLIVKQ